MKKFLSLIIFVLSVIVLDAESVPVKTDISIKVNDSVYHHRKRPTLKQWIAEKSSDIPGKTYRQLAAERKENGFFTIFKTLLLIPLYAIGGGGALVAGGGGIALVIMICLGLYATAASGALLFWGFLFPYISVALGCIVAGGLTAFGIAYLSEIPWFDKARPFAVGFYKVLGYILIGIFFLLFEIMDAGS